MDSKLEARINKLKSHFPAGERYHLEKAANSTTFRDGMEYLSKIYGAPTKASSAWARPLNTAPS